MPTSGAVGTTSPTARRSCLKKPFTACPKCREKIKTARLIAVPGCYPTAVQLGYLPLLEAGLIDPNQLIADWKSGVTGAGRGAKVASLLAEASESMKAYGAGGHRHLPEIRQGLGDMQPNQWG